MSDFPKGGDVTATRAWLDRKGFLEVFMGWEADAIMGLEKEHILGAAGIHDNGLKLWGYLNTARKTTAGGNSGGSSPVLISVEMLEVLDTVLTTVTSIEPHYVTPGSAGAPPWLRHRLPLRPTTVTANPIDLALPVDGNPFFEAMGPSLVDNLRNLTSEGSINHLLLLGCSGCGKTSACLALARERYVIFLEVPGHSSNPTIQKGFCLRHDLWSPMAHRINTFDEVCNSFHAEIAARLVVLKHLLQAPGAQLTPLLWLLYTMSEQGGKRIGGIRDSFVDQGYVISSTLIDDLLSHVTNLIALRAMDTLEGVHSLQKPILVVDELQALGSRKVQSEYGKMSLMRAVVDAACSISMPAVWSGTRMTVMTAMSDTSAFAKALLNARQLHVVGHYEYLNRDKVERLLNHVLKLDDAPPSVTSQLYYGLQGRARTCASFVEHLLRPGSAALRPGVVLHEVLLTVFEDFMSKLVIPRVHDDLHNMQRLPRWNPQSRDIGLLICRSLLPTLHHRIDFADASNCMAFTKRVIEIPADELSLPVDMEVQDTSSQDPVVAEEEDDDDNEKVVRNVRYRYEYQFGEPSLQEALLKYARANQHIADLGICGLLQSALTAPALGEYLDFAVTLTLLYKGALVLRDLLKDTNFQQYAHYTLSLRRVVSTSSAAQQLEWFQRVLNDPEDCEYSLLPGVPVKHIAILPSTLSGADAICVASSAEEPEEHLPSSTSGKRKRTTENPLAMVFVHICCATYNGGVDRTKHEDQKSKAGNQFEQSKKKCFAADRYKLVAQQYADNIAVIPVLVEVPQKKREDDSDVVMVTDKLRKELLLSNNAVEILVSRTKV